MAPAARSRRVKVLWLIKGLGPGGAEQLLLLAARVVDRDRFDVRIAFIRPDKTHLVPEFEAIGYSPVLLEAGATRNPLSWLGSLRSLMMDVEIVHSHSPVAASVARLIARSLPRGQRPALVTTEHNEWTSHRWPTRILNGVTAPLDDRRWAVSEQVKETIWRSRRRGYEVLIHGINTEGTDPSPRERATARAELGVGDDEILSLTVANLRKNKDYPNLLHAARISLETEPRLRFVAVGQGPLADEMRKLRGELGLGDRFLLAGFRRDIRSLMSAADLFTLASAHEGLPVAVMEAFAAGLPVVATRVGGIPQQVTDTVNGLLVPPGDPQALAEALITLAGDPALRQRMGAAAREKAPTYDIRRAVHTQEEAYAALSR